MVKIAISGLANSGKNTLATLLSKEIGEDDCKLVAFADPIKEIALKMFPNCDEDCLYGASHKRANIIPDAFDEDNNPLTYRKLLCDIGTSARKYNNNIWIDVFANRANQILNDDKSVIATDTRFREEIDYLKENDYFLIRLYRDTDNIIEHISETGQLSILDTEFNCILNNNKSLYDLKLDIEKYVLPQII